MIEAMVIALLVGAPLAGYAIGRRGAARAAMLLFAITIAAGVGAAITHMAPWIVFALPAWTAITMPIGYLIRLGHHSLKKEPTWPPPRQ